MFDDDSRREEELAGSESRVVLLLIPQGERAVRLFLSTRRTARSRRSRIRGAQSSWPGNREMR
jgi:hypothetical protein